MVLRLSQSSYGKSHATAYTWGRLQLLPFALAVEESSPKKGLGCFCRLGRNSAQGSSPCDLLPLWGGVSGRAALEVTVGAAYADHPSCPKCGHFGSELSDQGL